MKTGYKSYIIASLFALLIAVACTRSEIQPISPESTYMELSATFPSFQVETKADFSQGTNLFAYPLQTSVTNAVEPISQDLFLDGVYLFSIPDGTNNILFTNADTTNKSYIVSHPAPDAVIRVEAIDGKPMDSDILYGKVDNYSQDATKYNTVLSRLSSKLRIGLKVRIEEDTITNLTSRFDSVKVSINGLYSSVEIPFSLDEVIYSGQSGFTSILNNNSSGCSANNIHIFPSEEGAQQELTLDILPKSGDWMKFSTPLPKTIERNKYYDLNIYLSQNNADLKFELENIDITDIRIDDPNESDFDLLSFYPENLYFGTESGEEQYIIITDSKLGEWTAEIDAQTLSNYSFTNISNGVQASPSSTLYGDEGDTISVKTLRNNNGGETYLPAEIKFVANEKNSYPASMMQSNGQEQTITIDITRTLLSESYLYLGARGSNLTITQEDNGETTTLYENGTGYGTSDELYGTITISGLFITWFSITGFEIETFTMENCSALETIYSHDCTFNFNSFDFSECDNLQELSLSSNGTQTIDIVYPQKKKKLASLSLDRILFESLSLDGYENLTSLYIEDNTSLTSLSATNCPKLEDIYYYPSSNLQTLNLSNTGIKYFKKDGMSNLTTLNLSNCSSLETIYLNNSFNSLTDFNFSECTSLKTFHLSTTLPITTLDFTGCSALDSLYINENRATDSGIQNITLSGNNSLRSMYLYDMGRLRVLTSAESNMGKLYISNCNTITDIDLSNSGIRDFESSECSELNSVTVDNSTIESFYTFNTRKLASVDLSNSSNLKDVSIEDEYYDSNNYENLTLLLNGSGVNNLTLRNKHIETLDITSTPSLDSLTLNYCPGFLIADLSGTEAVYANISNCPDLVSIIPNKNTLKYLRVYNSNNVNTLDLSDCQTIEQLFFLKEVWYDVTSEAPIITGCTSLKKLALKNINKTTLDLTTNTQLDSLALKYCNNISSIDCSGLTLLVTYENNRTPASLKFRDCSSLTSLDLDGSELSELDIDGLTGLQELRISNTGLTAITMSTAPSLKELYISSNYSLTSLVMPDDNVIEIAKILYNDNLGLKNIDLNAEETLDKVRFYAYTSNSDLSEDALDLSGYSKLRIVKVENCYNRTSLGYNFSNCPLLEKIDITSSNHITSLNVADCPSLSHLDMDGCQTTVEILENVFTQLPTRTTAQPGRYCILNTGLTPDETEAQNKNWVKANDINLDFDNE